jgi:ATP-dependent RNA helicase RhlE
VRVLVATDIVARGIDVEALEHVVNFDVPHQPEDYIHRVGRTARADATGEAFTLVAQDEEADLRAIERAIRRSLPRRKVEGFDYSHTPVERFEVPIAERIAAIRARKADDRARAKAKLERRTADEARRGKAPSGGGGGRGRRGR